MQDSSKEIDDIYSLKINAVGMVLVLAILHILYSEETSPLCTGSVGLEEVTGQVRWREMRKLA
jgi:hypothetical protein